jgi:hypothetical protein
MNIALTDNRQARVPYDDLREWIVERGGPGCLNRFSASISGASAGVRLPSGGAAA